MPVVAQADDVTFPKRHPGLWEQSLLSGDARRVSTICVDAASDRKLLDYGFAQMRRMGGKVDITGSGNHFHIRAVTDVSGHTVTTNMDLDFKGDKLIQSNGNAHIDPPIDGVPVDTEIKQESRWTGPCPADMAPGDFVSDGRKRNVLKESTDGK
jgi:hypothetical protein